MELIRADFIKKAGSEEKSIKQKILEENYRLFSDLEESFVNEQIWLLQTGEGNKFIDKLRPLSKSVNEIVGAVIISAFTECLAKIIAEKNENFKKAETNRISLLYKNNN